MLATAAAAFFVVSLLRSFRWVKVAMINGTKPWACDLCMSFWATVLIVIPSELDNVFSHTALRAHLDFHADAFFAALGHVLASAGLCLLAVKAIGVMQMHEPMPSLSGVDEELDEQGD